MLDGHYKATIDRFWDAAAGGLVRLGLTPNQVTWAGLGLVVLNCGLYAWHRDTTWLGVGLSVAFAFDALDGAVARITASSSKYGGYLDAVIDRYQEILVFLTLAWVNDYWGVCFLAITGSLLISYNKARTAIEMTIDNDSWPDLVERLERVVIICAALIFDSAINSWLALPEAFLYYVIWVLAALTHIAALQRFLRARRMLKRDGCGPGCGTDKAGGCGEGCAGCSAAAACRAQ